MRQLNINRADSQLMELIHAALNGEDVVITEAGHPVLKLVLVDPGWRRRGAVNTAQLDIIIGDSEQTEAKDK
ncbi:hypothetical protein QUF64_15955 [Anaerolineales bacterium HSG6]|nr:hypothetical protein [Anaerolineales bacterium HSG6]